jgi:hypothetical protein
VPKARRAGKMCGYKNAWQGLLRKPDSFWDVGAFRTNRKYQKAFKMVISSRVEKREQGY